MYKKQRKEEVRNNKGDGKKVVDSSSLSALFLRASSFVRFNFLSTFTPYAENR
jgi:hypothetical protein